MFTIKETILHPEIDLDDENYSCDITIVLKHSNEIIPLFSKDITVLSTNSQTGHEVNSARNAAIESFLNEINGTNQPEIIE